MAYENIRFHKSHMATRGGYFYLIDYPNGLLSQKTSDGNNTFQYPLDIPNSFTSYTVNDVICLQYDGYSLWSLQDFTDGSGVLIRQWIIDNHLCVLYKQFPQITTAERIYNVDTISVEYYNTFLTNDVESGSSTIYLDEYTDFVVFKDTVLGIGYNKYGYKTLVTVSGVEGYNIYLTESLTRDFYAGDPVVIAPALFIFNNYDDLDNSLGALIMLNSSTGEEFAYDPDVEYLGIGSSKFSRLKDVLQAHPDAYTLAYVKGTNLKLRDMTDMFRYRATIVGTDDFDGPDFSTPNDRIWDAREGNPRILNNKLFCATAGNGHDQLHSKYTLLGDFDVQVSGSMGNRYIYGAGSHTHHYLGLEFFTTGETYYIRRSVADLSSMPYITYDITSLVDYTLELNPIGLQPPEQTCIFSTNSYVDTTITGTYVVTTSGVSTTHYIGYVGVYADICPVRALASGTLNSLGVGDTVGYVTGTNIVYGEDRDTLWFDGQKDCVRLSDYEVFDSFKSIHLQDDFEMAGTWWYSSATRGFYTNHYNSGSYSARLGGSSKITSRIIHNVSDGRQLRITAWAKNSDGTFNTTEAGDNLYIEYLASDLTWKSLGFLDGGVSDGTVFNIDYVLPEDSYHGALRVRFRNSSTSSPSYDFWFVDDVMVFSVNSGYEASTLALTLKFRPDSLSADTNIFGLSNMFFCRSYPEPGIIFMDDFSSSSNWSWSSASLLGKTSKYGLTSAIINGNEYSITLITSIDLSIYLENIKLYVWVQEGSEEWGTYWAPESTDYLRVEYYNDVGSWIILDSIFGGSALRINERNYLLPEDAYHNGFRLRFRAFSNGTGADAFAVGDVIIYDATEGDIDIQPRPALALGISSEGALQVILNNGLITGRPTSLTFGTNDIIVDTWNDIAFSFNSGDVKVLLNNFEYTAFLSNKYLIDAITMSTYIGHGPAKSEKNYTGLIDSVDIHDNYFTSKDFSIIVNSTVSGVNDISISKTLDNDDGFISVIIPEDQYYHFRAARVNDNLTLYYKYEVEDTWTALYSDIVDIRECYLNIGLQSKLVIIHDSYFDDLIYSVGMLRFPTSGNTYYGIMQMDNIQTNQSTLHTIYDIDIEEDNLYRLQKTATYYGSNYSWSTYNFQISPIRSFIDFITVDSDTHILPATGRNVTSVRSVTLDQYGQGVVNRPVTFVDDDDVGFINTEVVYTDIFYNTGRANTAYTSGTDLRIVTINAKVTQLD